jgi:SAM-dependent methyltransferase
MSTTDGPLPDHVARNRTAWDRWAADYVAAGERNWASDEPRWGIWGIEEAELNLLPADLAGRDAIELGCGTAYVSAWLARRGAHPVGVDNSERQLDTARRLQREHGVEFPLIHANAEAVPLPDASFDLVISEYGAAIWADPHRWIPEAARLLRPGGDLLFLGNGTMLMLAVPDEEGVPAGERLLRPYFGMHRFEWPGDESVEFHLGYADWIRLLRANDLEILDLVELQPPADATTGYEFVTTEWARRWPSEQVWKARRPPGGESVATGGGAG